MKLSTMTFRVILALVLSSVVTIVARLVMEIIIPSNVQNTHNVSAIALSIISPVTLSVLLIYLLHIYGGGSGESEVCEEYPDKYPGIFKDIPRVAVKERLVLLFIISLGLLGTLVHLLNAKLLHSTLVERFASLFMSATSIAVAYPSLPGFLLGTLLTALIYITVYALFRFKWRKFM
jgi:hypothetical protein